MFTTNQVAIVLQGRQAGKKVVIIKQLDEGTKDRPYPHAIVAGVERYPRKVTRRMGQKKLAVRSKVKPFIKVSDYETDMLAKYIVLSLVITSQVVNYSHLFPTRYALELEGLKNTLSADTFKEPSQREDAKKNIKKLFEDRYTTGKNKWFFQALRVRPHSYLLFMQHSQISLVLSSFSYWCPNQNIVCNMIMHTTRVTFAHVGFAV